MANKCEICGKGPHSGMQISHSHRRSRKSWKPNIQRVRAVVKGSPRKIKVCTRCLKSGRVQRAK